LRGEDVVRSGAEEAEGEDGEGEQEKAANLSAALAAFAFGELAGSGWKHECLRVFRTAADAGLKRALRRYKTYLGG
jgi:hypothetical protein